MNLRDKENEHEEISISRSKRIGLLDLMNMDILGVEAGCWLGRCNFPHYQFKVRHLGGAEYIPLESRTAMTPILVKWFLLM